MEMKSRTQVTSGMKFTGTKLHSEFPTKYGNEAKTHPSHTYSTFWDKVDFH